MLMVSAWADERQLASHCRGWRDTGSAMQWTPVIPTCGWIPQRASRIGCFSEGGAVWRQEEDTDVWMREDEDDECEEKWSRRRERWRECGSVKERKKESKRGYRHFSCENMSWNVCGWNMMDVQIQSCLPEMNKLCKISYSYLLSFFLFCRTG